MTETATYIRDSIKDLYPPGETRAIVRLIMEQICGITTSQFLLGKGKEISDTKKSKIKQIVEGLRQYKPIQYLIGIADFYGMELKVNPSVLIPRPETAELVDRIIHDLQGQSPHILDIGTGSGCIAIALAKHLHGAKVTAIDISPKALSIAQENAHIHNVHIHFQELDILSEEEQQSPTRESIIPTMTDHFFDCIVSNPPYIMEKEKKTMEANVLNYEPHQAMFVPDENPLLFYKAIASYGRRHLKGGGLLYLEINPLLKRETSDLFTDNPYKKIECLQDLYGKDRFIKATL